MLGDQNWEVPGSEDNLWILKENVEETMKAPWQESGVVCSERHHPQ